jgi:YggT family protein
MIQSLLRVVSALLTVYILIIFLRILLSWFQGADLGKAGEILHRITDPYLNIFRGIRFLRIGNFDFSVIVAMIVLWIVSSIVNNLAYVGTITLGFVLALTVSAVASAAGFFLTLFLILGTIRVIGMFLDVNTAGRFWIVLDQILEPMTYRLSNAITRGRGTSYRNALLLFLGIDALTLLIGNVIIGQIVFALQRLPI